MRPDLESLPRVTPPRGNRTLSISVPRQPIQTRVWCLSTLHVINHALLGGLNWSVLEFKSRAANSAFHLKEALNLMRLSTFDYACWNLTHLNKSHLHQAEEKLPLFDI